MQPYFFIDSGKRYVKVSFVDIIYIEACCNYVRLVTTKGSLMALLSMRQIGNMLPSDKFCRIHRSYIVSIDCIQSFVSGKVYVTDKTLPIGESYSKALLQRITIVTSDYLRNGKKVNNVLETVIASQN
ncbi:MAG: LytTR family DNA-binding domain-containing protein [Chitinophagaceae bacterium]